MLETNKIYLMDCMEGMLLLDDNSIDSIVTDPPAGISFMNLDFDKKRGGRDKWTEWLQGIMVEALRCLKPGGHALVWSLPRTSHWTATALENAGFEIRDIVSYIFGQGFPKSLNISKAIDKKQGSKKQGAKKQGAGTFGNTFTTLKKEYQGYEYTNESLKYEDYGTGLKPACEFWILCRKPISENTIVENVLKHGTGGLNIKACLVPLKNGNDTFEKNFDNTGISTNRPGGRYPANLILDGSECVEKIFGSKIINSFRPNEKMYRKTKPKRKGFLTDMRPKGVETLLGGYYQMDIGTASCFFYHAKPSVRERNEGCYGLEKKRTSEFKSDGFTRTNPKHSISEKEDTNSHPTIKSKALMSYLIKLITPVDGIVLDMFAGSGTTCMAAIKYGYKFIAFENDEGYYNIALKRIEFQESKQRLF